MNIDEIAFFDRTPGALRLYEAVRDMISLEFEDVTAKVHKTQISFSNRHGFAFVSLPYRKVKGSPDVYIILTFGLNRRSEHPRVWQSVEPYPGRWTHYVIIQNENEVDAQIAEWIMDAYWFANEKRRARS